MRKLLGMDVKKKMFMTLPNGTVGKQSVAIFLNQDYDRCARFVLVIFIFSRSLCTPNRCLMPIICTVCPFIASRFHVEIEIDRKSRARARKRKERDAAKGAMG